MFTVSSYRLDSLLYCIAPFLNLKVSHILKSGGQEWVDYNSQFYKRFDMKFTGFVIQGLSGQITSGTARHMVV